MNFKQAQEFNYIKSLFDQYLSKDDDLKNQLESNNISNPYWIALQIFSAGYHVSKDEAKCQ